MNNFFETKVEENINFDYLIELEKIVLDGNLSINFCKLNSIPKDLFPRIKTFFINAILYELKNPESYRYKATYEKMIESSMED